MTTLPPSLNCEIEFLPVGEESKAGDAIIIRYGTEDDFKRKPPTDDLGARRVRIM